MDVSFLKKYFFFLAVVSLLLRGIFYSAVCWFLTVVASLVAEHGLYGTQASGALAPRL